MATMQKITPNLWFAGQAEEAANYYTSIFKNSKIGKITRYGKEGQEIHKMPEGSVMTIEFTLDGQDFLGLNGGPYFQFNEAISLMVKCKTQKEIDYYWEKLSAVPQAEQCGWLKDKFGFSWQIVPEAMDEMLSDENPERVARVTEAFLKMKKFDLAELENAYQGVPS